MIKSRKAYLTPQEKKEIKYEKLRPHLQNFIQIHENIKEMMPQGDIKNLWEYTKRDSKNYKTLQKVLGILETFQNEYLYLKRENEKVVKLLRRLDSIMEKDGGGQNYLKKYQETISILDNNLFKKKNFLSSKKSILEDLKKATEYQRRQESPAAENLFSSIMDSWPHIFIAMGTLSILANKFLTIYS